MRTRLWTILDGTDPDWGRAYALFNNGVILLAVLSYTLSTLPDLSRDARATLDAIEFFVITVFALDYVARVATAPRALTYVFSFWGLVDLLSFLPALLFHGSELTSARLLRILQLARILKLVRLAHALETISDAVRDVKDQLLVFLMITVVVLFLAAVGIYQFEHKAQPEVFASIPHSLWWAVATLSTVGYGDIYPITGGGRFFTALVLLIGLAVIAVPTGLISASLVSKAERKRQDETDCD